MITWVKNNDAIGTVNRGVPCESGLCTLCDSACKGKCETWLSSLKGRKLLYPRNFGQTTSGSWLVSTVGIGYHALRIQGYAYGAKGIKPPMTNNPDDCLFTNADVTTSFGHLEKTKCRVPIMTGALGSTFIARNYWESFAVGSALSGIPIVVGENVVGVDKESVITKGRIEKAPELDRRIETFFRYYDGYGAMIVQMNVEDTRNGVAEYIMNKYGNKVIMELKWGQGAKNIGGEIQVTSLEYAKFLKDRGYLVDPDPYNPVVESAFKARAINAFARHSRLGGTELSNPDQVRESFMNSVDYLRKLGFTKITLKTGAYDMEALAMAIRFAADANLDLLTIDGSGGGTGMSPWNMMQHWGIPSVALHAKAFEYCRILDERGLTVPDISFAGGFAREDHIFKAIAMGAPYSKLVCMGRAPMIPGFLGSNIEGVFKPEKRAELHGHWEKLPPSVQEFGKYPEEIFAGWEPVKEKVGAEEMDKIPFGAIAMYAFVDKLTCGLQQFMAGARKFSIGEISRSDLMAANRETEEVTGLSFMTDAKNEEAMNILKG
jgi:glutamate synthase domain-containing protein 2